MACAYMGAGADRRVRVYDEIPRRDPDESPEAGELAFSNYYFYRPANSPPELQPDERSTIRKIGNIANRGWTAALPELGKMGIPPEALALRAGNLVVIRIPEII